MVLNSTKEVSHLSHRLTSEEGQTWAALLRMTTRLDARLNRNLLEASGLSSGDYHVLSLLIDRPSGRLRVFELATELQWERSRLSHHLLRMQRRGLTAREECTTDRRGAFVMLTSAGQVAFGKAAPVYTEIVHHLLFEGLTKSQLAALQSTVSQVLSRLD